MYCVIHTVDIVKGSKYINNLNKNLNFQRTTNTVFCLLRYKQHDYENHLVYNQFLYKNVVLHLKILNNQKYFNL